MEVAGPEPMDARELAWCWRSITGRRALVIGVPVPGRLGRALRSGAQTFAAWLTEARHG
ncbi:hypothetical protein ACGFNU_31905 [Spirillospora sp. NPDC048911]|uniref:hypothetical protein n=1 Tax=Spirillospora sp. NPDC048911 TaxID=3364527 RepID=UPI00371A41D2